MSVFRTMLLVAAIGAGCAPHGTEATPPAAGAEAEAPSGPVDIDGARARALVAEGALLVDVRTPQEFAGGAIEGALNVPVQELGARLDELEPKERAVVVYCRSGNRSATAAAQLSAAGFERVYDLGSIGRW